MTQRIAIPSKVIKILPLMGSLMDGEALNACRAVGRVLQHSGLTYQDLAAVIPTTAVTETVDNGHGFEPPPAYRPSRRKVSIFTPAQAAHHRRMALWCRNNERGRLTPREREFIANIASWRRELSIPQADWLVTICDRLEQEDRRAWS
ncbi:hypothetical protein [Methylobacterium sp. J-068]|uniref:hypothetical protein n=1 Tax=Methylobacterium sp. J-068 TaxID=2836649 RepID=UPI001FBA05F2|nr:hypothetical protein [Methylobacterium sp. J-068]MCJ2036390.1 hypothetical protein [Methylobacterium sp. J-068]